MAADGRRGRREDERGTYRQTDRDVDGDRLFVWIIMGYIWGVC